MHTVLLVEDDAAITDLLRTYLRRGDLNVLSATSVSQASALLARAHVVLLDAVLLQSRALTLARQWPKDHATLPIVVLVARGEDEDARHAHLLCARDTIIKPVSPREVVARMHSLLRHPTSRDTIETIEGGSLRLNPATREVHVQNAALTLSPLEFDLLRTLVQHPGVAWTRERLLDRVWGLDFPRSFHVIDAHVEALRSKLSRLAAASFIAVTTDGCYRFEETRAGRTHAADTT